MARKFVPLKYKILLFLACITSGIFVVVAYVCLSLTHDVLVEDKKEQLLGLARVLEKRLPESGYTGILAQANALDAPILEKVRVLNRALRGPTDEIAHSVSGLGIGFYSRELDAIITYGPSSQFFHTLGLPIALDHPGRTVMAHNTPMVRFGSMVRGEIMNAMHPVVRGGEVVGYIWANMTTADISDDLRAMTRKILPIVVVCFAITLLVAGMFGRQMTREIGKIIRGVHDMARDFSTRIDVSGGELGKVAQTINQMAEIVERSNKELLRTVSALERVLDSTNEAIYVCDLQTMELVYANTFYHKRAPITAGLACYKALWNLDAPCPFCNLPRLRGSGDSGELTPLIEEIRHPILERELSVMERIMPWPDGRRVFVSVAADISTRKELAMATSRNQAQRDFLARMSHEIRTPMNGVLGMAHLALQAQTPDEKDVCIRKIESSANILLGVINDILDFSRIQAGKMTIEHRVFNLHEVVSTVHDLVLPRISEQGLEFPVVMEPSVPRHAKGDKLRLSQVLLNLLGNAAKFTQQGAVSLRLQAVPLEGGRLRLECAVSDTGIGMDETQQAALFSPFSQADESISRRFGGSGLGLSISKTLVELMGGSIAVHSEAGKGSTFSFSIMLEQVDEAAATTEERSPWEAVSCEGYTFLLAEDNTINQEIAAAVLNELGASVDTVDNGEQAVSAFLARDYDVIFMDMRMPVLDGLGASRRIRASGKHDALCVPIIAMTANVMSTDKQACIDAGMNAHVGKPLDLNELKRELYQCLFAQREQRKV